MVVRPIIAPCSRQECQPDIMMYASNSSTRRHRQVDLCEFRASLVYSMRPINKNKKNQSHGHSSLGGQGDKAPEAGYSPVSCREAFPMPCAWLLFINPAGSCPSRPSAQTAAPVHLVTPHPSSVKPNGRIKRFNHLSSEETTRFPHYSVSEYFFFLSDIDCAHTLAHRGGEMVA